MIVVKVDYRSVRQNHASDLGEEQISMFQKYSCQTMNWMNGERSSGSPLAE